MSAENIRLQSVNISFRDEQVLQDIDLAVDDGEFCVIVGPSGCGKSTLLQSIAGLSEPDSGTVYLNGDPASSLSVQERNLGYVFQEFEDTLFPHMTVEENVAFGVRQQDEQVDEEQLSEEIDEMLDLLAIGDTRDDLPSGLSGGQQQRVELARQLIRGCDTILLDDPLADLDYKLQKRMELEIRRIHEELESTFLYVTHNQDQALKLADTVVVMNRGRIEQIGTPSEVYHNPNTAFVANFIGDNNITEAELVESDGDAYVAESDIGRFPVTPAHDTNIGETGILGIRPVNVAIGEDAAEKETTITATLDGSTYMGDRTEIDVRIDGYEPSFYIIVPGKVDPGQYGDEITLGWDVTDAQFLTDLSVSDTYTISNILEL